jgi:hypothetical protein
MKRLMGFIVLVMLLALAIPGYCGTTATMGKQDIDDNYTVETDADHVVKFSSSSVLKSAADSVCIDDGLRVNEGINYGASLQGNDSYKINLLPRPTVLATGMVVTFNADVANVGACTLDIDDGGALAAKALKSLHNQDPADLYIETSSTVMAIYDGTYWTLQTPDANP